MLFFLGAGVMTCIVCFDDLPVSDISIQMPCGHVCCDECWRGVLAARLSDGDVHRTCCPAEGCVLPLTKADAQLLLADDSDFERYVRLLGQKVRKRDRGFLSCQPHIISPLVDKAMMRCLLLHRLWTCLQACSGARSPGVGRPWLSSDPASSRVSQDSSRMSHQHAWRRPFPPGAAVGKSSAGAAAGATIAPPAAITCADGES